MLEDIRELDSMFYRVERNGQYVNRCFSDLTPEEQEKFVVGYEHQELDKMYNILETNLSYIYFTMLSLKEKRTMIKEQAKFLKDIAYKLNISNAH